jgi:hypothetical protein
MRIWRTAVLALFMMTIPRFVPAQAWLPDKGEGSVSFTYQFVNSSGHFLEDGSQFPGYQSRANALVLGVQYGLTNRLAAEVNLPYLLTRYTGSEEPLNLPENVLDDGNLHGTFQDFQFGLHCNVLRGPVSLTPFAVFSLPSHDYEVIGEAAAGPGLKQFIVGTYAGRLLDPVIPRTYVEGMYSYGVVEKVEGIPLNRSNMELTVGRFLTRSLSASFIWRKQWMHGGLNFSDIYAGSSEVFRQSDRLTRQNFDHVGADVTLSLTESVSAHVGFLKFAAGQNAHFGEAVVGGMNWRFTSH